jgi:hypothetical protein
MDRAGGEQRPARRFPVRAPEASPRSSASAAGVVLVLSMVPPLIPDSAPLDAGERRVRRGARRNGDDGRAGMPDAVAADGTFFLVPRIGSGGAEHEERGLPGRAHQKRRGVSLHDVEHPRHVLVCAKRVQDAARCAGTRVRDSGAKDTLGCCTSRRRLPRIDHVHDAEPRPGPSALSRCEAHCRDRTRTPVHSDDDLAAGRGDARSRAGRLGDSHGPTNLPREPNAASGVAPLPSQDGPGPSRTGREDGPAAQGPSVA